MKRMLVIGAAGDVGQGIVRTAIGEGWTVAAAGRDGAKLDTLVADCGGGAVAVPGSIASEQDAKALLAAAKDKLGGIDAVVVSVNGATEDRAIFDWTADALAGVIAANVLTHFVAAKTIIPALDPGGVYIGIGGGMADFVPARRGQISMAAAALRNMYRAIAREHKKGPVHIRELLIASMVNGSQTRTIAEPGWVTDEEVGRHVCAIVAAPERFPGPILSLKSREQAGQPDVA